MRAIQLLTEDWFLGWSHRSSQSGSKKLWTVNFAESGSTLGFGVKLLTICWCDLVSRSSYCSASSLYSCFRDDFLLENNALWIFFFFQKKGRKLANYPNNREGGREKWTGREYLIGGLSASFMRNKAKFIIFIHHHTTIF